MNTNSLQKWGGGRIKFFDTLRGFTMILVVLQHVSIFSFDINGYETVLNTALISFRMPLFFFVSGFFAYRAIEKWTAKLAKDILKRKIQAQIVCTIVFFAIFSYCHGSNIFGWINNGFGAYWFTITLFQMFVIYVLLTFISKATNRHYLLDIGLIALSIILFPLCYIGSGNIGTVLCWINLEKYFQFFAIGILARKYQHIFLAALNNDRFRTSIVISYITFMILMYLNIWDKVSLHSINGITYRLLQDVFVRYAGLFTVIIFFYSRREYFNQDNKTSRLLCFIGRRTLDIYMLHYFFLPPMQFMHQYIANSNMLILQLAIGLALTACIIAVCLILSNLLRSSDFLASWLFGVKPKKTAAQQAAESAPVIDISELRTTGATPVTTEK